MIMVHMIGWPPQPSFFRIDLVFKKKKIQDTWMFSKIDKPV